MSNLEQSTTRKKARLRPLLTPGGHERLSGASEWPDPVLKAFNLVVVGDSTAFALLLRIAREGLGTVPHLSVDARVSATHALSHLVALGYADFTLSGKP